MTDKIEEARVVARFAARLYLAPLVGGIRGAVREVRGLHCQLDRNFARFRSCATAKSIGPLNAVT